MSFRNRTGVALKDLVEQAGEKEALRIIKENLENDKVPASSYSLKEIYEAVSSDMFPQITGELINSEVIKGYAIPNLIGDMLCRTVQAQHETERYVGFTASERPKEVLQGAEYESSDLGEKYVTVTHNKFGRLIDVTEEAIMFDQTSQILTRARGVGQKAGLWREQLIVEGVQDVVSLTPKRRIFNPSGTGVALYRTSPSGVRPQNSRGSTPFGEEGLKQANKLFHSMTDENGDFINAGILLSQLLFPYDLWVEVMQMAKSTLVPEGTENAVNIWKGTYEPLTSPYVTRQNTTTWYLGNFKEQFVWSQIWPLQTFQMKPGNETEFRRDVKFTFKVRLYGGIGAVDDHYVLKFTA
jgi:hypothetical protein